jgi:hypothetical protein
MASASARVILVNMVILLMSKPELASADQIEMHGAYFRAHAGRSVIELHVFVRTAPAPFTSASAASTPGITKPDR